MFWQADIVCTFSVSYLFVREVCLVDFLFYLMVNKTHFFMVNTQNAASSFQEAVCFFYVNDNCRVSNN